MENKMKSVLISIRTEWVYQILKGSKTVEVRKTIPKLKTPFKCSIYCTKDGKEPLSYFDYCGYDMTDFREDFLANGNVVAEFVCDRINAIPIYDGFMVDVVDLQTTRLTVRELLEYAGGVDGKKLYGWHISDLKIYDKPKKLHEFTKYSEDDIRPCENDVECQYMYYDYSEDCVACGIDFDGENCPYIKLQRPPQSWCYVWGID